MSNSPSYPLFEKHSSLSLIQLCRGHWPAVIDELKVDHQIDDQGNIWVKTNCPRCQYEWMHLDPYHGTLRCLLKSDGQMSCIGQNNIGDILTQLTGHDSESIYPAVTKLIKQLTEEQFGQQQQFSQQDTQPIQHPPGAVTPTHEVMAQAQSIIPETARHPIQQSPPSVVERIQQQSHQSYQTVGIPFSQIVPEEIDWLWKGRLPVGKMVVLQGDPELGKSLATIDLTSRVTTGSPMPFETERREPASVIIMSSEDSQGSVIRPRLDAAGADTNRVFDLSDSELLLPRDSEKLEMEIRAVEAKLLILDPAEAYMEPRIDLKDVQSVRQVAMIIKQVAERTGCTIIWMRHLTKGEGGSALTRGLGSIGISAATRVILHVGADPQDADCGVLAVGKNNLAVKAPSLSFKVVHSSSDSTVGVVQWLGVSPWTAEDLIASQGRKSSPKLQRAKEIIREQIPVGKSQWQTQIEEAAIIEQISPRTLSRAKKELRIASDKDRTQPQSGWFWYFPEEQQQIPQ